MPARTTNGTAHSGTAQGALVGAPEINRRAPGADGEDPGYDKTNDPEARKQPRASTLNEFERGAHDLRKDFRFVAFTQCENR